VNWRFTAVLVLVLACLHSGKAQAEWVRYALVVGYNHSDDTALKPLRYADDDAVKHAQLLSLTTKQTILLTELDRASRRLFSGTVALAPTRKNVLSSLQRLQRLMGEDIARGDKPVLYFVYSGHGNYDSLGRGYVHLRDGRFTTQDIYHEVLDPTQGTAPHHVVLVVDACNAALLVNSRGSDRRAAKRRSLKLEAYPNVGVILSSSSIGEVHEWGRLLSGIFSHEVRSGLMGPADIDDDGRITFAELAAFIASANMEVRNETYRLNPYIRPPLSAPNMPLLDQAKTRFPARVRVSKQVEGRAYLMNSELLRFADFNKRASHSFWLGVPGDKGFVLVNGTDEYVVPAGASGDIAITGLSQRKRTIVSQRGTDQYFEAKLFARPHAPAAAAEWLKTEYEASLLVDRVELAPWYENKGAWGLLASGLGVVGAGVGLHVHSMKLLDELGYSGSSYYYDEALQRRSNAQLQRDVAISLYSIGGAATLGSILWFVLDQQVVTSRYRPPLKVDIGPRGVRLEATF
jgi:hypothetical protein